MMLQLFLLSLAASQAVAWVPLKAHSSATFGRHRDRSLSPSPRVVAGSSSALLAVASPGVARDTSYRFSNDTACGSFMSAVLSPPPLREPPTRHPPKSIPRDKVVIHQQPKKIQHMSRNSNRHNQRKTIQDSALLTILHAQALQTAQEGERVREKRQRALLTARLELEARERRRRKYAWRRRVLAATKGAWVKLLDVSYDKSVSSYKRLGQTWQWFRRGRQERKRRRQARKKKGQAGPDYVVDEESTTTLTVSSRNLQDYAATVAIQQATEELLQQSPPSATGSSSSSMYEHHYYQSSSSNDKNGRDDETLLLEDEAALLQNVTQRADTILSDLGMGL